MNGSDADKRLFPIKQLIHGTDEEAFLKIRREGISPMTRQHVHLATTVDVVHDYSTVHIYIDKYIYIIYMFKFTPFADNCGRSGRVVNPIICTYIHTFDICVRSR